MTNEETKDAGESLFGDEAAAAGRKLLLEALGSKEAVTEAVRGRG